MTELSSSVAIDLTGDSLDEDSSGASVLSSGDVHPTDVHPIADAHPSIADVHSTDVHPIANVHPIADAHPSIADVHPIDVHSTDVHPIDVHSIDVHPIDVHSTDIHPSNANIYSSLATSRSPPTSPPFTLSPLSSPVLSLPVVQFTSLIHPSHSLELDIEPQPSSPKEAPATAAAPSEEQIAPDCSIKEQIEGRTRKERKKDLDDDETEFEIIEDEMEDGSDLAFDDETAILDSDLRDLFDVSSLQENTSLEDEPRRKQSVKQTKGKITRKTGVKSRRDSRKITSSRSKQRLTRSRTREKKKERSSRKQETDWDTFIESSFSFSDVETSISENEIMGQLSEKIEELPKRGRKRTTAEKSNGLKEGRKKKQLQDRGKGRKMNGFKS